MDDTAIEGRDQLKLGPGVTLSFEPPVMFRNPIAFFSTTRLGAFTYFHQTGPLRCASFGRYCSVAGGLRAGEFNHPQNWLSTSPFQYRTDHFGFHPEGTGYDGLTGKRHKRRFRGADPVIGNDVWIGSNVTILRGVSVGDGAIIAAGSVVTKDVAPYDVVGGVPAKAIRSRFDPGTVARLQRLAWWRFTPKQLSGVPFDDIHAAMEEIERRIDAGLEPYAPALVQITAAEQDAFLTPSRWDRLRGR